jgi:hypothetical protein
MVKIPYYVKKIIVKWKQKKEKSSETPIFNYTMLVFKSGKTIEYGINDLRDRHEVLKNDIYLRTLQIVIINNRTKNYLKL